MIRYLLKRLFWMVPLLVGISLISFLIMHLAPGDITTTEAGFNPRPAKSRGRNCASSTIWMSPFWFSMATG